MSENPGVREDQVLIQQWFNLKDPRAFEELVRRHGSALKRVAAAVLGSAGRGNPELLADAFQDGLERLMSALGGYRGEAEPLVFMAAVIRRSCLDALRKERRAWGRIERAAALDAPGLKERAVEDPGKAAERALEADRVLRALDRLREPDRSLVYLRDAEGAGVAELARAFRMPEGTVKSRLARARKRLRGLLAKEGISV